jgi:UDPglucose 6-dehydrogenase
MNIGFLGLGKLGLPCALAIDRVGHKVLGYDIDDKVNHILQERKLPYVEEGAPELLESHEIEFCDIAKVVSDSDLIFVPIQTPHSPEYEGCTRMPEEKMDFNYEWLKSGIKALSEEVDRQNKEVVVVIISTVLPGTIRREIKPIMSKNISLCYNPFFIAMGTTIQDFTSPEFVLFGYDDEKAYEVAKQFYSTIHDRPIYKCTIEEAEMIKVTYNTFITMKICLANVVMEMSHKLENINCDNVMNGLFLANQRLISTKYLYGGMGDGGGCHPRDNIALSWLAEKVDLSFDWYDNLIKCREKQTEWLADLIIEKSKDLPVIILGKTFKKETNLTVGSPSILLKNLLDEKGIESVIFDPMTDAGNPPISEKAVYFIGTNHGVFNDYHFPKGSVVIDPWRYIRETEGVELIKVGDSSND